jgi:hypothetical protein
MKYNFLIILLLVISCSPHYTKFDNRKPYNSTGFAYIYDDNDFVGKKLSNKFYNDSYQVFHKDLKSGILIKLINPKTKNSMILKNSKGFDYPEFYKILISKPVALKLNIDNEIPLVEILEIKKNKSFIAEKAKIYQEEKKISTKAPVTSVKIANISKKKIKKEVNSQKIYILVASFYTNEAANLLKQRIISEMSIFDIKKLKIKKKTSKEFEVLSGPYKSINSLKNDYINLKSFGFEELDIFIDE